MGASELDARVESLTREIADVADRFGSEIGPPLREALGRSVDRLVLERAEWFNGLSDEAVTALRASVDDAVGRAAVDVGERLRNLDLWLNPTIEHARGPTDELDSLNHRVWIAILKGADVLDPVLTEFGLAPADVPDFGGGHFGLQPQRLRDLDPRGHLERLWRRYLDLYERRLEVLRRIPEERKAQDRDRAKRRWFGRG